MSTEPKPHKSHLVRHLEHVTRAAAAIHGRTIHARGTVAPLPTSTAPSSPSVTPSTRGGAGSQGGG